MLLVFCAHSCPNITSIASVQPASYRVFATNRPGIKVATAARSIVLVCIAQHLTYCTWGFGRDRGEEEQDSGENCIMRRYQEG